MLILDLFINRCPAWCDRILYSPTAKKLMADEENYDYGIMGENICMGDHKVSTFDSEFN
jgi:hypothetical protein